MFASRVLKPPCFATCSACCSFSLRFLLSASIVSVIAFTCDVVTASPTIVAAVSACLAQHSLVLVAVTRELEHLHDVIWLHMQESTHRGILSIAGVAVRANTPVQTVCSPPRLLQIPSLSRFRAWCTPVPSAASGWLCMGWLAQLSASLCTGAALQRTRVCRPTWGYQGLHTGLGVAPRHHVASVVEPRDLAKTKSMSLHAPLTAQLPPPGAQPPPSGRGLSCAAIYCEQKWEGQADLQRGVSLQPQHQ